ncbi:hypothetical protein CB1_001120011 [Camelus ferus]|nr:hypothetical protein CB1_001120011 [Camelus ferus]
MQATRQWGEDTLSVPRWSPQIPRRDLGNSIKHRFSTKYWMSQTCTVCGKGMLFGLKCKNCKPVWGSAHCPSGRMPGKAVLDSRAPLTLERLTCEDKALGEENVVMGWPFLWVEERGAEARTSDVPRDACS